jgi:hypothetical protein
MFRSARNEKLAGAQIDEIEPVALKADGQDAAIAEIFQSVSGDKPVAAGKVLSYLRREGSDATALMSTARRLLFQKGNNAHDYKFSSAVLEDYANVSPAWRDRYLASSVYMLRGSGDRDNDLMQRVRAALV